MRAVHRRAISNVRRQIPRWTLLQEVTPLMVLWCDGARSRVRRTPAIRAPSSDSRCGVVFDRSLDEDASKRESCMPDLTVIEGGGPEGRGRVRIEQEFEFALREAAEISHFGVI